MYTDRCGNTRRQKCCAKGSGKEVEIIIIIIIIIIAIIIIIITTLCRVFTVIYLK